MDLSLVVPVYNEKENLGVLIRKIMKEFKENAIDGEVIVVDDNSPDGTGALADKLKNAHRNIRVIHREGKMGLSSAVLSGFDISSGDVLGVMDADLSHPPSKIHELLGPIKAGKSDLAIGSRYVNGGNIIGWGFHRRLQSKVATLLARPYTSIKDPMSGFFMVKKSSFNKHDIDVRGFKILFEIIVKSGIKNMTEVPITFVDRKHGKSKMDTGEIVSYVNNLIRYVPYRSRTINEFLRFALVGFTGILVNLFVLFALTEIAGLYYLLSAVFAFAFAATSNYLFNKKFTFREGMRENVAGKYVRFMAISIIALFVNVLFLFYFTEFLGIFYTTSQVFAIAIAFFVNYYGNKKWTFV